MSMRRLIGLVVMLAALSARADASLILALGTPQRIVVAADSLVHTFDKRGRVGLLPPEDLRMWRRAGCKVAISGPLIFGQGGQRDPFFGQHRGALEVWDALAAVSRESVTARMDRLVRTLLREPLAAGFDEHVPVVSAAELHASAGASHFTVYRKDGSSDAPFFVVPVIEITNIDTGAILAALKRPMTEQDVIAMAERVIREQARRTPGTVGGPIDVAVVTPGAQARWVTVKPGCQ
jgi:hypothetical protein